MGAGSYRFYFQDEYRCELFDTVEIRQPDPLRDTISQDSTVCYLPKGSVSVQVQGGTAPYSYVWTNQQSGVIVDTLSEVHNLDTGYYRVEVTDAHGCKIKDSVKVLSTVLPAIEVVSIEPETCEASNGKIAINVQHVTIPISYTWTPNPTGSTGAILSNVKSNIYSVHIEDVDGCTADTSIYVHTYPTPLVSIQGPNYMCEGIFDTLRVETLRSNSVVECFLAKEDVASSSLVSR